MSSILLRLAESKKRSFSYRNYYLETPLAIAMDAPSHCHGYPQPLLTISQPLPLMPLAIAIIPRRNLHNFRPQTTCPLYFGCRRALNSYFEKKILILLLQVDSQRFSVSLCCSLTIDQVLHPCQNLKFAGLVALKFKFLAFYVFLIYKLEKQEPLPQKLKHTIRNSIGSVFRGNGSVFRCKIMCSNLKFY